MIHSSPVPLAPGRFELEAKDGERVHARLGGRCIRTGYWGAHRVKDEDGGDPAAARKAFALAFAAASARAGGEIVVVERDDTLAWREALVDAGFRPGLRKVFVERRLDDGLPSAPTHWRLRSLAEVGEQTFRGRMVEASEGDPFEERKDRDVDREWRDLVDSTGTRFDAARWHLADDDQGPIGVVLPQALEADTGTLYYVGVVPARRRAGLGTQIHALGLRLLASHGLLRYVGSTDVRNAAMRAVFARNGASVSGTETYFRWGAG